MPEKNLDILINSMKPDLCDKKFVFTTVSEDQLGSLSVKPFCLFREEEGVSLILEKSDAERSSLLFEGSWSLITCKINSDLAAVGFLAAMSRVLAERGIAVNAVSAYYHDHLFVPSNRAKEALDVLRCLSNEDNPRL